MSTTFGMSRRKAFATISGLPAALLAACAPGAQPGGEAARPQEQAGEINWMIADHNPRVQSWFEDTFIPSFTKDRPKVKVNMLYVGWGGDIDQKRDTLYAAGTGPDVIQGGAAIVIKYATQKIATPLDDRVKRWKDWGDFYPSLLGTMRFGEKQYGVPSRIDARAMVYRKDLFDKQGKQLPVTWNDMREAATALTRREGGQLVQLGFDPAGFNNQQWFPMVWQNGGEVLSADGRKPAFNTTEGIDALKFWTDLLKAVAPADATLPPIPQGLTRLANGTAAARQGNQGIINSAISGAPEALPHLVVRPPLKQKRQQVNVFNNWLALGTQSKVPDLSWSLMQHFFGPEHLLKYSELLAATAPRKSLASTGYMNEPHFQMKAWVEVVEKYARPQPLVPGLPADFWKVIDTAINDVMAGKQSPKQALDDGARQWQVLLDDGYRGA